MNLETFGTNCTQPFTFMVGFAMHGNGSAAPLNQPMNFFLRAAVQADDLMFPFDAALHLQAREWRESLLRTNYSPY